MADGDGRYLLTLAETLFNIGRPSRCRSRRWADSAEAAPALRQKREEHYNLISALHKSVRGSDPDAALYWLARMLTGGEDPLFIARRLCAWRWRTSARPTPCPWSWPMRPRTPTTSWARPRATWPWPRLVVHLAAAPKSNAVYVAYKAAIRSAKETGSLMPPAHIRNAPTKLMKDLGYGKGYAYDHDTEEGFSGQNYFPEGMARQSFYQPKAQGSEARIKERLERWAALRAEREGK
jgi:putative ATPase